jgi:hypothetical protein
MIYFECILNIFNYFILITILIVCVFLQVHWQIFETYDGREQGQQYIKNINKGVS